MPTEEIFFCTNLRRVFGSLPLQRWKCKPKVDINTKMPASDPSLSRYKIMEVDTSSDDDMPLADLLPLA
ncbi:hypothetical protein RRG08_009321 [Elysia crispata]|uniref:Uncharacterized protein n=1 Tax=Elysia crispata TaxID=231223 RepID=A0AAE0ZT81_9GAST|nr:hypothetical protein RRG08_009321 [Elysia crispata]